MGSILGAAIVSHHPGLMQCEEFRLLMGAGSDSDLIPGYRRVADRIERLNPDLVIVFDSHWFTTGYHLVDGAARYRGVYVSDEMPWYLHGLHYDYAGCPAFADLAERVSREQGSHVRAIRNPDLGRQYGTLNVIRQLRVEHRPVVSVSSCQNCRPEHFLQSGRAIGEAIRRGEWNVVLLASGALSHRFNDIDWTPKHPRIFHELNVSRPENVAADKLALTWMRDGRHDLILSNWDEKFRLLPWEAFGAHFLQMIAAMGGADCRARGEPMSDYENARGTGNIHVWFDL